MKRVQDRVVAAVLCFSVALFCSVTGVAAELRTPVSLGTLLSPGIPMRAAVAHGGLMAQPQSVASQTGRVAWKSLGGAEPAWSCRTAEGSSVALDLGAAGKVSIPERSSVSLRAEADALVVTLLGGSVALEPREAGRARIETYDAVYRPEAGAGPVRVAWRAGSSSATGSVTREAAPGAEFLSAAGVAVRPAEPRVSLSTGRAKPVAVVVTDASGEPLAGVPVEFSTGPDAAGVRAARVALAGGATARALTSSSGVAATTATPLGEGEAAIAATVAGLPAAAVPADAAHTGHTGRLLGIVALVGLAAVTIALVIRSSHDDDPKLTPGPPTLVR